ncbi:MAG: uroporphyrinogen decarboxylase family protein [Planctomycetota bacterium]
MTPKERVLAAVRHRQPDQVPWHVGFTAECLAKMKAFTGDPQFVKKLDNCFAGVDAVKPGSHREVEPGVFEDEFGVRWDKRMDKDIGVPMNSPVTPENLEAYPFPDPADPARYESWPGVIARNPHRIVVAGMSFSLYERAWSLAGMETVLMGMVAEPDFIHRLLDRILEYNLAVIERACAFGIDAFRFGDDWGSQTGIIMGAARWREFIKPRVAQMYALAKKHGKLVMIHSCGKVDSLFDALADIGVDVVNPFQPEVMDPFETKKRYGARLTFHGGISTQRTLPAGTVQQVKDEVKRLLDEVGKGGGYIASPAHRTPADAKPENVLAMIEVLRSQ